MIIEPFPMNTAQTTVSPLLPGRRGWPDRKTSRDGSSNGSKDCLRF
jgi:hypothetical protein